MLFVFVDGQADQKASPLNASTHFRIISLLPSLKHKVGRENDRFIFTLLSSFKVILPVIKRSVLTTSKVPCRLKEVTFYLYIVLECASIYLRLAQSVSSVDVADSCFLKDTGKVLKIQMKFCHDDRGLMYANQSMG